MKVAHDCKMLLYRVTEYSQHQATKLEFVKIIFLQYQCNCLEQFYYGNIELSASEKGQSRLG